MEHKPVKPCPFCGGEAIEVYHLELPPNRWQVKIDCHECGGQFHSGGGENLEMLYEITVKNWNNRAGGE